MTRKRITRMSLLACAAAGLALTPGTADAQLFAPTGATATPHYTSGADDVRSIEHAIDGSGLNASNEHTNAVGLGADPDTMYLSNNIPAPVMTFTLAAAPVMVDGFRLWNYNEQNQFGDFTARSIRNATVSASTDNVNFTPLVNPVTNTTTFTFTEAPGTTTYGGEFYFLPQTTAQYIRFNVIDNHGTEGYTGISEIRFNAVPEPTALGLLALGGLGLLARRRRRRLGA